MGFFNWLRRKPEERGSTTFSGTLSGANILKLGGEPSESGIVVTPENSIQCSAVYASVRVISDTISTLPLLTYKRTAEGRERAENHPLYNVLKRQPNEFQTTCEWLDVCLGHLLLWGNSFSYVEKNGDRPVSLLPLSPISTRAERRNGHLIYKTRVSGVEVELDPSKVVHFKSMSFDGLNGISPIERMKTTVGLSIATDRFGAKFYSQGSTSAGILSHPQRLSEEAQKNLRNSLERSNSGLENAHRYLILQEGMKFEATTIPADQAQFIETRSFQARDIASRIFKAPPHLIGDMEHGASFKSIEHQAISFFQNTIKPYLVKIEQQLNSKLLREDEKDSHFIEFEIAGLLRGDLATQDQSFQTGVQNGWYSINDVRKLKNLPPVSGGDIYLRPLNMTIVGEDDELPDAEPRQVRQYYKSYSEAKNSLDQKKLNPLFEDAVRRITTKEQNAIKRAIKKFDGDPEGFQSWADEFYQKHEETTRHTFSPLVEVTNNSDWVDKYISDHWHGHHEQLRASKNITETVEQWKTNDLKLEL